MRYLILKSPKTNKSRCDMLVYLEFDTPKVCTGNKIEMTFENLDQVRVTTYIKTGEYRAVKTRNKFLSETIVPTGLHHRSI